MLKGEELGRAIEAARKIKNVTKRKMAADFGIKDPSVQDWVKHGRISKDRIPALVKYFEDVVDPEHWGLPKEWGTLPATPNDNTVYIKKDVANMHEIRRQNLERFIGEPGRRGRITDFANKYDIDSGYISQILNKSRNMGEKAARKLEAAIDKPAGYLDIPTDEDLDLNALTLDQIALLQGYISASPELKAAALRLLRVSVDSKN
ncbi:MAG: hypothetical protein P8Y45_20470 [Exilibacterium sp.]